MTQPFDSRERVRRVTEPLLFVHGTADGVIPHWMSDELHAAAGGVPPELKRVVKIDGANHRGAPFVDRAAYDRALLDFLAASVNGPARGDRPG